MANDVVAGPMITAELDEALARLAAVHGKSKSDLICQALTEYVAYEEAFAAAVEEARTDIRAGDFVPHEQVVRETREFLARKR
jgi:predicted transcriptional regulator